MLVNYKLKNVYGCGEMQLIPGINKVDEKVWAEAQKFPKTKWLMENEHLEVVEGEGGKKLEASADESLASLSEKKAVKLVEETFEMRLLEQWKKTEKRNKVLDALDARMDEINKA